MNEIMIIGDYDCKTTVSVKYFERLTLRLHGEICTGAVFTRKHGSSGAIQNKLIFDYYVGGYFLRKIPSKK